MKHFFSQSRFKQKLIGYLVMWALLLSGDCGYSQSNPQVFGNTHQEKDRDEQINKHYFLSNDYDEMAAPNVSFQNPGTMVQAHNRGTFYASHSSIFKDDEGRYHTFYCTSVKPFVQNESPGWDTNEATTFYAADAVRYESFDANSMKSLTGAITFLVGSFEIKPQFGVNTIKMVQSPCTSSTVKFNNYYYTFFESFTEGSHYAQMVSIHVARSATPGENPEVLTVQGWQPLRTTKVAWKPVITSSVFNDYPKHRDLINTGAQAARDNWGVNSYGNFLWGMGVPSAVVREGRIYLVGWDNVYFPEACRLVKTNGRWETAANSRCGRNRIVSSLDGENFQTVATPDFTPGGDLKLVNDPQSDQHGNFAFFWNYADANLKSQRKIGLSVSFATPDFKGWSPAYQLGHFPSRVSDAAYNDLGGVFSPRVAGNAYGEIAPTTAPILLQMAMPRTAAYSKPQSIAENREIYSWLIQLNSKLSPEARPVQVGDPGQVADAPVVPSIVSGMILKDNAGKHSLNLCGTSFTNQAAVRLKWSHLSSDIWYSPTSNTNRAIHYIGTIPTSNNHPPFCIFLSLKETEVNYLRNGNTVSAQVHQVSNNTTSAARLYKASDLPESQPLPPPPPAEKPFKIIGPKAGAKNVSLNPTLSWTSENPHFVHFMVDVSDKQNFSRFWNHEGDPATQSIQYFGKDNGWGKEGKSPIEAPSQLKPNTFYWIRVSAFDENWKILKTTEKIKFKTQK